MLPKSQLNVLFLSIAIVALFFMPRFALADDAVFDPNNIISDNEITDSTTMTVDDIQQFLESKGSYLADYSTANADGVVESAAQIIYDAAVNNYDCDGVDSDTPILPAQKPSLCKKISINPKFLLVLIQKEEGLIEDSNPCQAHLDWAAGYGCPDNSVCNSHWKGFGKQINSAALQFFDYMQNPQLYTYQIGATYNIKNTNMPDMSVTPMNYATAGLYDYTPHVYNGNYNFWKLWQKYFTTSYTNNTLLQAKGSSAVWLIADGKKRPFLTEGALTSRFDIKKIVIVPQSELDKYLTGAPIKFPQYSIVRSPRGTVYLLVDDQKRGFTSKEALRKIGVNPEEIISASWDDLNAYADGVPITATTTYPTGALFQDKKTGGVFYVSNGTKAPIWEKALLLTKFRYKLITRVDPKKLASYQTVTPVTFDDGELLKTNSSQAVYVIDNQTKRPFSSGDTFEKLGYQWYNVLTVSDKLMNLYPLGSPIIITSLNTEIASSTCNPSIATSSSSTISTSTISSATATTSTSTINSSTISSPIPVTKTFL